MDEQIREEILSKRRNVPIFLFIILFLIVVAGAAVFVMNAAGESAKDVWLIYLVNFVFWTGVAQAGVVFSCALRITSARWGRPLLRISESFGSFLPVSFIMLLVLFIGKDYVLPYASEHYHHPKEVWLSIPFVFGRNVIGLLVIFTLSFIYLYYSLRQDLGGAKNLEGISAWVASGWKGEEDRTRCWNALRKLAPAIALVYAVTFSVIAWDFMMSLDSQWYSTLFGPYYFMGSFLAAIGATIVLSAFVRKFTQLEDYITEFQYYDMGKLLLGFSMFWVYLMFSQFLPIWYANMPEETGFVVKRVQEEPFKTLSWVVLSSCFFFPFFSLLPRTNKIVTPILVFIATVSLSGLWLDKFLLITPSLTNEIRFGLPQILITAGFASAFVTTFLLFIRAFPIIPIGDPFYDGKPKSHHGGH